eukprot:1145653-Pelagomonas_calceolata.AAC.4
MAVQLIAEAAQLNAETHTDQLGGSTNHEREEGEPQAYDALDPERPSISTAEGPAGHDEPVVFTTD